MNQAYDAQGYDRLAAGRHGDPFSLLGPHDGEVRSFQPGARGVVVLARDGGAELGRLEQVHPAGIFAGKVSRNVPYRLRVEWPGLPQETEDPYSFGLLLGRRSTCTCSPRAGTSSWRRCSARRRWWWTASPACASPSGRRMRARVSVVGDFNGWDGGATRCGCAPSRASGNCSCPRLLPGARYKYDILGADGARLPLKADPLALADRTAARHRLRRRRARRPSPGPTMPGWRDARRAMRPTRRSRSTKCMPAPGCATTRGIAPTGTGWPTG